jgi:hypothetical protein
LKDEEMVKSDITKRPKRNGWDIFHTLTKAGVSIIPYVGGPVKELLSLVITPSIEQRRDEWIKSIAEGLKDLEVKVESFKIENLCGNEAFISTIMQASQVAIRNHQREKLEALKNAVLNAAMPNALEENMQFIFLNFVDSFTPGHLKTLKILNDYEARYPRNPSTGEYVEFVPKSARNTVLPSHKVFPDIVSGQSFYDQVLKDLRIRGLIELGVADDAVLQSKIVNAQLTKLGEEFMVFISSPIKDK